MLTADQAWWQSLEHVFSIGTERRPRNMITREILNDTCEINMNFPVITNPTRKLSYKFMAAEAYWITSGSALVEEIAPYCKHIANYSDDGYIFNGAYGPMFDNQLEFVVATLNSDYHSRQAVMTIWHPNPTKSKDHKCTVSLQFLLRDKRIHTVVNMRSNDLWLGRPYDIFNFTMMTHKVRSRLDGDVLMGTLYLNAGSAHIYARDFDRVKEVLDQDPPESKVFQFLPWKYMQKHLLNARNHGDLFYEIGDL